MNRESQMHFEGMEPNETVFHKETHYGDDIGDPGAGGVDDMDLKEDRSNDTDADSGEHTTCGVDGTDVQNGRADDAAMDSAEPTTSGVDQIGLLDDLGDDAVADSGEQAAPSTDGVSLPDDSGNDVAPDFNEQTALIADDNHFRDDLNDDTVADPYEQAAPSPDDIGPQDDLGDDAATALSAQDDGDDDTSSGSVRESLDAASNLVDLENELPLWPNDRRRISMDTPGWPYPISELAFKVRPMTGDEFSALFEDTKEHGQRLPITRWRGEIIDGVHRLLACLEAGVEPWFEDLSDDADPEAYVKSANVFRRHLKEGEVIETAVRMSGGSRRGRRWPSDGTGDNSANLQNKGNVPLTQKEASAQFDISQRTLAHGAKVFSPGSTASPELQQAVREDKIAVSDASKVVSEPPEIQQRAVDLVVSGESKTVVEAVGKAHRESAGRSKGANADSLVYDKDGARIYRAGAIDLVNFVPPTSVDVVISAPAPQDICGDRAMAHAAILASEGLRNDGLLILAGDSARLQQQLAKVKQRRLEWICQVHLLFRSPISTTGEPHYIEQRTVPLLLFGKSGTRLAGGDDVILVPPQWEETKDEPQCMRHAAGLVIGRFVEPGQVVCVPDLSDGSSNLLLAAARAGCKIIAADDKPSRIEKAVRELSKLRPGSLPNDQIGA